MSVRKTEQVNGVHRNRVAPVGMQKLRAEKPSRKKPKAGVAAEVASPVASKKKHNPPLTANGAITEEGYRDAATRLSFDVAGLQTALAMARRAGEIAIVERDFARKERKEMETLVKSQKIDMSKLKAALEEVNSVVSKRGEFIDKLKDKLCETDDDLLKARSLILKFQREFSLARSINAELRARLPAETEQPAPLPSIDAMVAHVVTRIHARTNKDPMTWEEALALEVKRLKAELYADPLAAFLQRFQ